MKKIIVIGLLCFQVFYLIGCTNVLKKENKKIEEDTKQHNSVVLSKSEHVQNIVQHEFSLDEHFFRASYIVESKDMPKDDYDALIEKSQAIKERPEVFLFQILASTDGYTNKEISSIVNQMPPRFIKSKNCKKEFDYFEVFQTLTDKDNKVVAALTHGYKKNSYIIGPVFFFPVNFRNANVEEMLYDGLKIEPINTDCVIYYDTFTYESKGSGEKTVPRVLILPWDKELNPEYEEWALGTLTDVLLKHPELQQKQQDIKK